MVKVPGLSKANDPAYGPWHSLGRKGKEGILSSEKKKQSIRDFLLMDP